MAHHFSWKSKFANPEIRLISIFYGNDVNQIYGIRVRADEGGENEVSSLYGKNYATVENFVVPEGEHITKIYYSSNQWLTGIKFETDKAQSRLCLENTL